MINAFERRAKEKSATNERNTKNCPPPRDQDDDDDDGNYGRKR